MEHGDSIVLKVDGIHEMTVSVKSDSEWSSPAINIDTGEHTITAELKEESSMSTTVDTDSHSIRVSSGKLMMHWTMEDTTSEFLSDSAGNDTGELKNGISYTSASIQGNAAMQFDGEDDFIEIDTPVDPTSGIASFSISWWMKPESSTGENPILEWNNEGGGRDGKHFWQYSNESDFYMNSPNCSKFRKKGRILLDRWAHYTLSYEASSSTYKYYRNGKLIKSTGYNCNFDLKKDEILIGHREGDSRYYSGLMDEIRIYNRALSETDIQTIMSDNTRAIVKAGSDKTATINSDITFSASDSIDPAGIIKEFRWDFDSDGVTDATGETVTHTYNQKGEYTVRVEAEDSNGYTTVDTLTVTVDRVDILAHWSLNETSGSIVKDSVKPYLDGTISDGITLGESGQIGTAYRFDGSTGHLEWSSSDTFSLNQPGDRTTVNLWVNPASNSQNGSLIGKVKEWMLRYYHPTPSTIEFVDWNNHDHFGETLPLNSWSMVSVSWTAGDTGTFYVDGETIATFSGLVAQGNSGRPFEIGKRSSDGGKTDFFEGKIDDVCIYNQLLPSDALQYLYNRRISCGRVGEYYVDKRADTPLISISTPSHGQSVDTFIFPVRGTSVNTEQGDSVIVSLDGTIKETLSIKSDSRWLDSSISADTGDHVLSVELKEESPASKTVASDSERFTVDPKGLEVHWTMEDTGTEIIKDRAGPQNGTAGSQVSYRDDPVAGNASIRVRGVNGGKGQITSEINPDQTTNSTFSFWVKPLDGGKNKHESILNTANGEPNWGIYRWERQWKLAVGKSFNPAPRTMKIGQWAHVTAVFDVRTKKAKLYLNGQFVRSRELKTDKTTGTLKLGGEDFDGLFDEVRIYDRALSGTEVESLYSSSSDPEASITYHQTVASPGSITLRARPSDDPGNDIDEYLWDLNGDNLYEITGKKSEQDFSSLASRDITLKVRDEAGNVDTAVRTISDSQPTLHYWSMEDTTTAIIEDQAGTYAGVPNGDVSYTSLSAGGKSALNFDGNGDYVETQLNPNQTENFTLTAWARSSQASVGGRAQIVSADNHGYDWSILQENSSWRVFTGTGSTSSGVSTDANQWYQVAAVYNTETNQTKIYVNGELQKIAPLGTDESTETIRIGDNPDYDGNFSGLIDEVRVYDRILTDTEVQILYRNDFFTRGPRVDINDPASVESNTVPLTFTLFDREGRNLNVDFDVSVDNGSSWRENLKLTGDTTSLAASRDGVSHQVIWKTSENWDDTHILSRIRVRAQTDTAVGKFGYTGNFNVHNKSPEVPVSLSPVSDSFVAVRTAQLSWSASSDSPLGTVNRYDIQVASDTQFNNVLYDSSVNSNQFNLTVPDRSGTYFWHVRAIGVTGLKSNYSSPANFTVKAHPKVNLNLSDIRYRTRNNKVGGDSVPVTITLQNEDNESGTVTFEYRRDPDGAWMSPDGLTTRVTALDGDRSGIEHRLYWNTLKVSNGFDTGLTLRVRASDRDGTSPFYYAQSFTVDNQAPTNPITHSPRSDSIFRSVDPVEFRWVQNRDDPFGYVDWRVQVASDTAFNTLLRNKFNKYPDTNFSLSPGNYYWRLRTIDREGNRSSFTEPVSFAVNDSPIVQIQKIPDPVGDTAPVDFVVEDIQGDSLNVTVQASGDGGLSWHSASVHSGDMNQVASSSNGVHHSLILDSDSTWNDRLNSTAKIRLRVSDQSTTSPYEVSKSFQVDLERPDTPSLQSPSSGVSFPSVQPVGFTWDSNRDLGTGNFRRYELQIASDTGFHSIVKTLTSYNENISTLLDNGRYWWRVRGRDQAGNASGYSTYREVVIADSPIIANWNSPLTIGGTTSIDYTLKTADNQAGTIDVEVSLDGGQNWEELQPLRSGYRAVSGSQSGENHTLTFDADKAFTVDRESSIKLRARAYDGLTTGPYVTSGSLELDNLHPARPDPVYPAGDVVTAINSFDLKWNPGTDTPSDNLRRYRVQVAGDSSFWTIVYDNKTSNSPVSLNLPEDDYYWRVRSQDDAQNNSAYSAAHLIKVRDRPVVSNVSVPNPIGDTGTVDFTVRDLSGDDVRVTVEYRESATDDWQSVSTPTTLKNLSASSGGTSHSLVWETSGDLPRYNKGTELRFRAADSFGTGPSKLSSTFTVDNVAPHAPHLKTPSDNGETIAAVPVDFDWESVTDTPASQGVDYRLQVAPTASFSNPVLTTTANKALKEYLLSPGTYYWRVKAIDRSNNASSYSTSSTVEVVDRPWVDLKRIQSPVAGRDTVVYTVRDYDADPVDLHLEYSLNKGTNWNNLEPVSGQLRSVSTSRSGTNHSFVWNTSLSLPYESHPNVLIRARATAAGSASNFARSRTFAVDNESPFVPSLVSPENGGSFSAVKSVKLDWTKPDDKPANELDTYTLQVSPDESFSSLTVEKNLSAYRSRTKLKLAEGMYHWRVKVIDDAGNESLFSSSKSFSVGNTPSVKMYTPEGPVSDTVDLEFEVWDPLNRSGTVSLQYSKTGGRIWKDASGLSGLPASIVASETGVKHVIQWNSREVIGDVHNDRLQFRVKFDNGSQSTNYDYSELFTVDHVTPSAPSPVQPDGGVIVPASKAINFKLAEADDPAGGKISSRVIEISRTSNFDTLYQRLGPKRSTRVNGLPVGTYYYRARAIDQVGNKSPFSQVANFRVGERPEIDFQSLDSVVGNTVPIRFTAKTPEVTAGTVTLQYSRDGGASWTDINADAYAGTHASVVADSKGTNTGFVWKTRQTFGDGTEADVLIRGRWKADGFEEVIDRVDQVTIDNVKPSKPYLAFPTGDTIYAHQETRFQWTDSFDLPNKVQKYFVEVSDTNSFDSPVASFQREGTGLKKSFPSGTYHWRVKARDPVGYESDFSEPDTFTAVPYFDAELITAVEEDLPASDTVTGRFEIVDTMNRSGTAALQITDDGGSSWRPLSVLSGDLTSVASSPSGVEHSFTWNLRDEVPDEKAASDIGLRLKVTNGHDTEGWMYSNAISIDRQVPLVPKLSSPINGETVTARKPVVLDWLQVKDPPKGVPEQYTVQLDNDTAFDDLIDTYLRPYRCVRVPVFKDDCRIKHQKSINLTPGEYYWRVKTTDFAGNESKYSEPEKFNVVHKLTVFFNKIRNSGHAGHFSELEGVKTVCDNCGRVGDSVVSDTALTTYTVSHPLSSPVSVEVQISTNGGNRWDPLNLFRGERTGLRSSPSGVRHRFGWNSSREVGFPSREDVLLRIRATTGGETTAWVVSNPFNVDNQSPQVPQPRKPDASNVLFEPPTSLEKIKLDWSKSVDQPSGKKIGTDNYFYQIAPTDSFNTIIESGGPRTEKSFSVDPTGGLVLNVDFHAHKYTKLPPGHYVWRVKATDNVGNRTEFSEPAHFRVDTGQLSLQPESVRVRAIDRTPKTLLPRGLNGNRTLKDGVDHKFFVEAAAKKVRMYLTTDGTYGKKVGREFDMSKNAGGRWSATLSHFEFHPGDTINATFVASDFQGNSVSATNGDTGYEYVVQGGSDPIQEASSRTLPDTYRISDTNINVDRGGDDGSDTFTEGQTGARRYENRFFRNESGSNSGSGSGNDELSLQQKVGKLSFPALRSTARQVNVGQNKIGIEVVIRNKGNRNLQDVDTPSITFSNKRLGQNVDNQFETELIRSDTTFPIENLPPRYEYNALYHVSVKENASTGPVSVKIFADGIKSYDTWIQVLSRNDSVIDTTVLPPPQTSSVSRSFEWRVQNRGIRVQRVEIRKRAHALRDGVGTDVTSDTFLATVQLKNISNREARILPDNDDLYFSRKDITSAREAANKFAPAFRRLQESRDREAARELTNALVDSVGEVNWPTVTEKFPGADVQPKIDRLLPGETMAIKYVGTLPDTSTQGVKGPVRVRLKKNRPRARAIGSDNDLSDAFAKKADYGLMQLYLPIRSKSTGAGDTMVSVKLNETVKTGKGGNNDGASGGGGEIQGAGLELTAKIPKEKFPKGTNITSTIKPANGCLKQANKKVGPDTDLRGPPSLDKTIVEIETTKGANNGSDNIDVSMRFDMDDVDTANRKRIKMFKLDEKSCEWYPVEDPEKQELDLKNEQITATTDGFSFFRVLVYAPGSPPSSLSNLNQLKVAPNPYKPNDGNNATGQSFDGTRESGIWFLNLPPAVEIKIYTVNGELVGSFKTTSSGEKVQWNVRNEYGQKAASGWYLYKVKHTTSGQVKTGKIAVIR